MSVTRANVAAQTDEADSLLNHYRQLTHLRNASPALQAGDFLVIESSAQPVYSFLRYTDDETLLVIINLHQRAVTDYELTLEAGPLLGGVAAELLLGDGMVTAPTVNAAGGFDGYVPLETLPPRSSFILRLNRGM